MAFCHSERSEGFWNALDAIEVVPSYSRLNDKIIECPVSDAAPSFSFFYCYILLTI